MRLFIAGHNGMVGGALVRRFQREAGVTLLDTGYLARAAFDILHGVFQDRYGSGLALSRITLYETPNCWAEVNGPT